MLCNGRGWRGSRRTKYTIWLLCTFLILFTYLFLTTTFIRDVGYLTRPLWDKPEKAFTLLPQYVFPVTNVHESQRLCQVNGWKYQEVKPRVIDAFIFSNELDILEIRIRELWDVVDTFVILESNRTFSGHPKPYFFSSNRSRFQFAASKIISGQVGTLTPLKPGQNPFDNETEMRRQMNQLLTSAVGLRSGDLLIISDVDEIPRKSTISLLKTCTGWPETLHLQMTNFVYSFEFKTDTYIWRPKIVRISSDLFPYYRARTTDAMLMDAGWHCSFCFRNIEDFIFKMQAYSHVDRITNRKLLDKEALQEKICKGEDIFDMYPEAYTFRDLLWNLRGAHRSYGTVDLPQPILENPVKFRFLLPGGCDRDEASPG